MIIGTYQLLWTYVRFIPGDGEDGETLEEQEMDIPSHLRVTISPAGELFKNQSLIVYLPGDPTNINQSTFGGVQGIVDRIMLIAMNNRQLTLTRESNEMMDQDMSEIIRDRLANTLTEYRTRTSEMIESNIRDQQSQDKKPPFKKVLKWFAQIVNK